jgi:hypothetical protein
MPAHDLINPNLSLARIALVGAAILALDLSGCAAALSAYVFVNRATLDYESYRLWYFWAIFYLGPALLAAALSAFAHVGCVVFVRLRAQNLVQRIDLLLVAVTVTSSLTWLILGVCCSSPRDP